MMSASGGLMCKGPNSLESSKCMKREVIPRDYNMDCFPCCLIFDWLLEESAVRYWASWGWIAAVSAPNAARPH